MRPTAFLYLLGLNLSRRPGRTLLLALALGVAASFATAVAAAMVGLPAAIFEQVERHFPARRLTVRPRAMTLAMVQVEATISPAEAERFAAMPGVGRAWPVMPLRVPLSIRGTILGNTLQADSFVWGVPEELVAADLSPHAARSFEPTRWQRGTPSPAVVPIFFIEMYNSGLALASGLPQVNRAAAIGQRFDLLLGETTLLDARGPRLVAPAEAVGVSDDFSMLAILLPLETVAEMNAWYHGAAWQPGYHLVFLELARLDAYDAVVGALEAEGYRVSGNRDLVATTGFVVRSGAAVLAVLGLMVVGLAALLFLAMLTLTLQDRAGQIGLVAAVGGARRTILALYALEVAILVVVPSLVAAGAATLALGRLEARLLAALPSLPFVPASLLWLPWWLPLGVTAALLALVAAVCGAQLVAAARRGPMAAIQASSP